jgi:hypothetical protein
VVIANMRALGFGLILAGAPIDQAISVGDICVQLGAAWFIVFAMPRRHPRLVEPEAAA